MNTKRKICFFIILILIILTLGFIWINSAVSATTSVEESGRIYNWILAVSQSLFGVGFSEWLKVFFTPHVFRKIIHFCEFAILGTEFFLLYVVTGRFSARTVHEIFCIGMGVAIVDELIQFFSGRNCLIVDVLLDTLGYTVALTVCVIILLIKTKRKTARM